MSLQPLEDRVIIKPIEKEKTTASGIYLAETKDQNQKGEVIAFGPGTYNSDGELVPLTIKKGDIVLYGMYSGSEIKDGDEKYIIMRESDLLATLN